MHTSKDILRIFQENFVALADTYETAEAAGTVTLRQANELTQAREEYQQVAKVFSGNIVLT